MAGFDGFGEHDAYNFVMEISSPAITSAGGLVGSATGLFGIAAGEDLFSATGNNHDEATGTGGIAVFQAGQVAGYQGK